MLMLFNRRELITLSDNGLYMDIKQILQEEGIPNYTKFISGEGTARRGIHGGYHQPLIRIYVQRNDYDRAMVAMQVALRNR